MTLPRELSLVKTAAGYRLLTKPVAEMAANRGSYSKLETTRPKGKLALPASVQFPQSQMEVLLEFEGHLTVELSNANGELYRIGYDAATNEFFSDRTKSGQFDFSRSFTRIIVCSKRKPAISDAIIYLSCVIS